MNMLECMERNSRLFPDKTAYAMVTKTGYHDKISHQELNRDVNNVAAFLREYEIRDHKVVLMLPSSINYITSFWGIIKAGAVAVPAYPITNSHHRLRLESILNNARPSFIITDSPTKEKMEKYFGDLLEDIVLIDVKACQESELEENVTDPIDDESIAYLQYTSGSTSDAKGVIITHKNIMANETALIDSFGLKSEEKIVTWLPFYHDMGLVGNIILTVFLGASCFIMDPVSFVQSPLLWLKTISNIGGTYVTAPNFAFQMCIDEITDEELEGISLANLRNAVNGAEPVRLGTIHQFVQRFASYGFAKDAMKPSYGLAENTLLATTYLPGEEYHYQILDQEQLSEGMIENVREGVEIVAAGHVIESVSIVIANPDSKEVLGERRIGEILISSDSASQGYWNKPEINELMFQINIGGNRYIRTGDLGYLDSGHLYIVSRIKDLIIIRGKNYYPQDIELTIEESSNYVKRDSSAAFSVLIGDEEKLIIVGELDRNLRSRKNDSIEIALQKKRERRAIINRIYQRVLHTYRIEPFDILLIQDKSIPKTSSGKIQRQLCKHEYSRGDLKIWERMKEADDE